MDVRNPAPPTKPWNDVSLVNINKQWFPMVSKWCRILSTHSRVQVTGVSPRCLPLVAKPLAAKNPSARVQSLASCWLPGTEASCCVDCLNRKQRENMAKPGAPKRRRGATQYAQRLKQPHANNWARKSGLTDYMCFSYRARRCSWRIMIHTKLYTLLCPSDSPIVGFGPSKGPFSIQYTESHEFRPTCPK